MTQPNPARNLSIDLTLRQLSTPGAALLMLIFVFVGVAGAQRRRAQPTRPQSGNQQIGRIEVVGLKRLTPQQVISTSGLHLGQSVSPAILDAAAQKLMDSGLFKKLGYQVRSSADQAVVIFTVEEAVRRVPVLFDNFAWFTDEQIYVAVRRDVTFFDGTVPEDGDTTEKVAASLRRLLGEKGIAGDVSYMPIGDESGRHQLLFSVKGAALAICSVRFPGASVITEEELIKNSQSLLGSEYSRKDVGLFATHNLLPLYSHSGYLRAQFAAPATVVGTPEAEECKSGVAVTIPIDEGLEYSWERAEWTGNSALTAEQLSASLGMKTGEVADDRKIDKAVHLVEREYAKKGYMAVALNPAITFDDANRRVTYRFNIAEGPQYHMGEVTINGLSDEDSRRVKELWELAPGAVFEQAYVDQFVNKVVRGFLDTHPVFSGVPLKVSAETRPDAEKQIVNLVITFR